MVLRDGIALEDFDEEVPTADDHVSPNLAEHFHASFPSGKQPVEQLGESLFLEGTPSGMVRESGEGQGFFQIYSTGMRVKSLFGLCVREHSFDYGEHRPRVLWNDSFFHEATENMAGEREMFSILPCLLIERSKTGRFGYEALKRVQNPDFRSLKQLRGDPNRSSRDFGAI
ncbi:unnamed protein product [uncultured bacterium]|nr:unnamed protein product [uncultured bacterium]